MSKTIYVLIEDTMTNHGIIVHAATHTRKDCLDYVHSELGDKGMYLDLKDSDSSGGASIEEVTLYPPGYEFDACSTCELSSEEESESDSGSE